MKTTDEETVDIDFSHVFGIATAQLADARAEIERIGKLVAPCEGEQYKFEEWAKSRAYDMSEHPLHYLFTDPKTAAARHGWKAALEYVRANLDQLKNGQ